MCFNSEPTTEINDIIMPVLKQLCITQVFYSLKLIENACFKEGVDFVVQTVACSECLISLAQPAQKQNILQILSGPF